MARGRTYRRLAQRELLQLVLGGPYTVCTATGAVYRGGRQLRTYQDAEGYLFVRLYTGGARRAIALHRLVWMAATGCTVPRGFHVHHRDGCPANNAYSNLLCVHRLDHAKFHEDMMAEVPF